MPTAIDLFCGCGGMTKGLTDAGIDVICGIDSWKCAINSYSSNFHHRSICEDIRKLPPDELGIECEVDIIAGGPPCQGFSIAGKRDKNDPRNSLFVEYVKYVNYFHPKVFVLENVIGILSMKTEKNERVIDIILSHFEKDYNCHVNKLYASDFEVPQNRRRVIIVGIRKDLNVIPSDIPIASSVRIPVGTALIPREEITDDKLYLSKKAIEGIKRKKEKSKERGNGFGAQFLNTNKPSYTIPARYWKDGYDALVKYDDDNIRRLCLLELKRIQTFPDDYVLCGNKKEQVVQIGNAVPCRLAYHIGKYLLSYV